ncbi:hypothetical protein HanIR_Chr09g0397431 [Helianthus annuus]|nr:hypothetical protein HanIR_Chr09g0397431 [Helianthus annuus]
MITGLTRVHHDHPMDQVFDGRSLIKGSVSAWAWQVLYHSWMRPMELMLNKELNGPLVQRFKLGPKIMYRELYYVF